MSDRLSPGGRAAAGLRFAELELPRNFRGALFRHSMPGREEGWEDFVRAAREQEIGRLLCLAPREEREAKSPEYAAAVADRRLPFGWAEHPITDYGLPADDWLFGTLIMEHAMRLHRGERVLVHCAAGKGRTGLVLECLLAVTGVPAEQTRERVRRSGARPDTTAQREFIDTYVARVAGSPRRWGRLRRASPVSESELLRRAERILETVRRRHPEHAAYLQDLRFRLSTRFTATAGRAYWQEGLIELSKPIFELPENAEGLRNTVRHEIAHVVANRMHRRNLGHSEPWQQVFLELGGDGRRCHSLERPRPTPRRR